MTREVGLRTAEERRTATPASRFDAAAPSIFAVLVRRAIATWMLTRLLVLAVTGLMVLQGGDGTLFFSLAPVLVVPIVAGLLSEVDVVRRHEGALLGNLGIARLVRMAIAVGVAVAGELMLGLGLAVLRG